MPSVCCRSFRRYLESLLPIARPDPPDNIVLVILAFGGLAFKQGRQRCSQNRQVGHCKDEPWDGEVGARQRNGAQHGEANHDQEGDEESAGEPRIEGVVGLDLLGVLRVVSAGVGHGLRMVVAMNARRKPLIGLSATLLLPACGGHFAADEQARFDAGAVRHQEIREKLSEGDHAAAAALLVPFWIETNDPNRPRGTYFYGNLRPSLRALIREHPPARERVSALYAPLQARVLASEATYSEMSHWIEINEALDDNEALIAFTEFYTSDEARQAQIRYHWRGMYPRLIRAGRWDLAGRLDDKPLSFYPLDPTPLTQTLEVVSSLPLVPIVVVLGGIAPRVDEPYPFSMFIPKPGPTAEEEAARELRILQSASIMGGALSAAGRDREAAELYRRAQLRVGADTALRAFSAAYDEAGLTASFPPRMP